MQQGKNAIIGRASLLGAALIWGTSFFIMKDVVSGLPPMRLLVFRFTTAMILMVIIFHKRLKNITPELLKHGLICGALEAIAYIVQTYGLQGTTAGKNAFLTAVYCVLVPFADWLLFHRRPTRRNVLSGLLCLGGIGLVSLDGNLSMSRGDALTLLSGVLYALQVDCLANFADHDDPALLTLLQFAVCAIITGVGTLLFEHGPAEISGGMLMQLMYLAVVCTMVAKFLQTMGQGMTPPSMAGLLLSLESVFGVLFSVLFAGELLTLRLAAGFTVIFIAVVWNETGFRFLMKGSGE